MTPSTLKYTVLKFSWVRDYKTDKWCRVQMLGATLKLWSHDTDVQSWLYQKIMIKNKILALDCKTCMGKTEVILNTALVHFWGVY